MTNGNWWQSLDDLEAAGQRNPAPKSDLLAELGRGMAGPAPSDAKGSSGESVAEDTLPVSRRGFLHIMGFSLAATACHRGPVREAIPLVVADATMTPGKALHYATTCSGCEARCGLVVKTRDGRPIKVEGNALSPASAGATCAAGQASVLSLYDDTRLRGPRWQNQATDWSTIDSAIGERLQAVGDVGGKTVVLTGAITSPTLAATIAAWCQARPNTRHVSYQPVSTKAIRHAHQACYGKPVTPRYRFAHARAIVGLEADFLATWQSPVANARGYVASRRAAANGEGAAPWHAQFESRLSPTGGRADLRVAINARELGTVAHGLLERLLELAEHGSPQPLSAHAAALVAARSAWTPGQAADVPAVEELEQAAEILWRHRGAALVLAGVNDPAVQTLVAAINALLDSPGNTIELMATDSLPEADEGDLLELLDEIERGEIHALLVHGVNPVYDTPWADRFARAIDNLALSVSFADRIDETAVRADAICPPHHALESWDDAETVPGAPSLAQPVLSPLFDTRSVIASLERWRGVETTAYEQLRQRWRQTVWGARASSPDFESFWRQAVHDGVAPGPAPLASEQTFDWSPVSAASSNVLDDAAAKGPVAGAGRYDLTLFTNVSVHDGRHANNPWLQELPDPVSRTAWGNHAALAATLADELGLTDGDIVRLSLTGDGEEARWIELPILRQPGQAGETIAVALGYGREHVGPVGDGVGVSGYPLVGEQDGFFRYTRSRVSLVPTGAHQPLIRVQHHDRSEARPIVRDAAWQTTADNHGREERVGQSVEGAAAGVHHGATRTLPSLWPPRPAKGPQWGLAIDLDACVGCSACVIACQAENNVPVVGPEESARGRQMHWIRIDRYYRGPVEEPAIAFQPMMCQHCGNAPCETVCPVLATVHSADGLNQQVYNRCIGTRYCANNCPYKVRRFNWFTYARNKRFDYNQNSDLGTLVLNPDVTVRSRGVMEKCSMCVQRIQESKLEADLDVRPLADGDIQTACQQACPTNAITFGDREDPRSDVAQQAQSSRHYFVLEELGTRPAVGYLARRHHPPHDPTSDEV